ncbi:hypothetical protein BDW60DRAFT_202031, partial [Aspergillus nidulans var. acristatus]
NAVLVQQEIQQLCTGIKYQKEKQKTSRYFIQAGGSLTGSEGQPLTCSNCNQTGHNRLSCTNR